MGVGGTLALTEDVGDTYALENGTHSTTGLNTGTVACGLEDNLRTTKLGSLLVRDSAAVNGNLDEVFLSGFDAFGDSGLDFVGLAESPSYDAILVTNDNDSCKSEGETTLGDLCDTVDGNQTIVKLEIACGFYFIILGCHSGDLDFEAAVASCIGERLNATVEKVSVAVKNDFGDSGFESLLGDILAYLGGNLALGAFLDTLGRSGTESHTCKVVDELDVNLLVATEHGHAGTLSGTGDLAADAGLDFISTLYFCNHSCRR